MIQSKRSNVNVLQLVSIAVSSNGSSRGVGGPEVRVLESLPFWDQDKVNVFVAYSSDGSLASEMRKYPRWIDFSVSDKKRISTLIELVNIIKKYNINVIHTQGPVYTDFIATIAAKFCGIKNVVTRAVQISDFTCGQFKKNLYLFMDYLTKNFCDSMIAISKSGEECLYIEGCPKDKVSLVYNGSNEEKFIPDTLSSDRPFTIAMFAQMIPHKRHDLLIEALDYSVKLGRDWRLMLVGDGPLRSGIEKQAVDLGCYDKISFLGFQRNTPLLYKKCDVVVLVSDREGLPVTLIEAMASGKPCVASNIAGTSELIEHDVNGLLLDINNKESIYNSLAKLEDAVEQRLLMGEYGYQKFLSTFTISKMVKGYQKAYVDLSKV
ncbi:glycosyltransferase [Motiliproteus sp.]|uniref:glycosyltransferase n=1 Tax=Motiliproteus sp. TaxID=1898955 RepID=UPI003BAD2B31